MALFRCDSDSSAWDRREIKKKRSQKQKEDRWNNSVGAESVLALMERVSQACKVITVRPAE